MPVILQTSAMRPALGDLLKEMELQNRIGMRTVDVFDENLGGTALRDEEWDGIEGEGQLRLCTASLRGVDSAYAGLAFIQYTSGSTSTPKVPRTDPITAKTLLISTFRV